jgi:DNA invertase Pin-like site-specific DNA recombinase
MIRLLERIEAAGSGRPSLIEAIDTTGPAGQLMMQMLDAFIGFERRTVRERTRLGLKAAR